MMMKFCEMLGIYGINFDKVGVVIICLDVISFYLVIDLFFLGFVY